MQEGKQIERLKLVSKQFRKQRLALWAGRGPDPWCLSPAGRSFDRSCAGRKPAARGSKQVGSWQCRKASKLKVSN